MLDSFSDYKPFWGSTLYSLGWHAPPQVGAPWCLEYAVVKDTLLVKCAICDVARSDDATKIIATCKWVKINDLQLLATRTVASFLINHVCWQGKNRPWLEQLEVAGNPCSTSCFKVAIWMTKSLIDCVWKRWFLLWLRMHVCFLLFSRFEHILVHLGLTWRYLSRLLLSIVDCSWIVWTDLLMCPMPYIIKETPNYFLISSNYFGLRPQISGTESRKFLEIVHNLVEICHDLRHVSLWWISMQPFYNFISTVQPVNQVPKNDACSTELMKVGYELSVIGCWFQQSHFIWQPVNDLHFQSHINNLNFRIALILLLRRQQFSSYFLVNSNMILSLNAECLHFAHDVIIIQICVVVWSAPVWSLQAASCCILLMCPLIWACVTLTSILVAAYMPDLDIALFFHDLWKFEVFVAFRVGDVWVLLVFLCYCYLLWWWLLSATWELSRIGNFEIRRRLCGYGWSSSACKCRMLIFNFGIAWFAVW